MTEEKFEQGGPYVPAPKLKADLNFSYYGTPEFEKRRVAVYQTIFDGIQAQLRVTEIVERLKPMLATPTPGLMAAAQYQAGMAMLAVKYDVPRSTAEQFAQRLAVWMPMADAIYHLDRWLALGYDLLSIAIRVAEVERSNGVMRYNINE